MRRARLGEAERLRAIAVASKGHWAYDDAWLAAWGAHLTLDGAYLARHEVHVVCDAGQVVGFHALAGAGPTLELDHLWVLPERIGTGLGRLLFEHARCRALELGARRLEWDAEPGAVGFYERVGGRRIGTVVTSMGRELPRMALDL